MTVPLSHSLLDDPLIRASLHDGGVVTMTLPGMLAAMVRDEIASFPCVQAHQRHAWHATWVQVAAVIMHRGDETVPSSDEGVWRDLLLAATPEAYRGSAWHLVGPYDAPAFMQPAIAPGDTGKRKDLYATSDIDVPLLSRNHDIKAGSGRGAEPDEWLAALVSMQTQSGFKGPGNVGVARMNGAYASRSGYGLVPPGGPGARFVRDLKGLLGMRARVVENYGYPDEGGLVFLWLVPWIGDAQLSPGDMDPFFVEVARRVRLRVGQGGRIACHAWNNRLPRIDAEAARGNLGDPWTVKVTEKDGIKAFTGDAGGLAYARLVQLMFGGPVGKDKHFTPSPLTDSSPDDPRVGMRFSGRLLVRGKGKTEGMFERLVPVAASFRRLPGRPGVQDPQGEFAREMVDTAGEVERSVLAVALMKLANGGEPEIDFKDKATVKLKDRWIRAFTRRVDEVFFERLAAWSDEIEVGREKRGYLIDWQMELYRMASLTLADARREGTGLILNRARADARSGLALRRIFRKRFPDAYAIMFPPRPEDEDPDTPGSEEEGATMETTDA